MSLCSTKEFIPNYEFHNKKWFSPVRNRDKDFWEFFFFLADCNLNLPSESLNISNKERTLTAPPPHTTSTWPRNNHHLPASPSIRKQDGGVVGDPISKLSLSVWKKKDNAAAHSSWCLLCFPNHDFGTYALL